MFKKLFFIFCFIFLITTGCVGNNINGINKAIKIGVITPLSGDVTVYGQMEKNVVHMAVDEINNTGGVNNRKIEVIYEDGQCDGQQAATVAQKLIDVDKVKIILGGFCSNETLSIAPITENNKVILFSSASSNPQISQVGDYVFRNAPQDTDWVPFAAKNIFNDGFSEIGIITEKNDFTVGVVEVLKEYFSDKNGLLINEYTDEGETDYRTVITKIKQSQAKAVFINTVSAKSAGLVVKQIKELNIGLPIYSTYVWGNNEAIDVAGEAAEGIVYFDSAELPTKAKSQRFLDNYKNKFDDSPAHELMSALKYDSVYIIHDALLECGEETDCIKDYLYNLKEYDGTAGTYGLDERGDVVGIKYVVTQIQDGKPVVVE